MGFGDAGEESRVFDGTLVAFRGAAEEGGGGDGSVGYGCRGGQASWFGEACTGTGGGDDWSLRELIPGSVVGAI